MLGTKKKSLFKVESKNKPQGRSHDLSAVTKRKAMLSLHSLSADGGNIKLENKEMILFLHTYMWNQTAYKAARILFLRFLHPDNLVTYTCAGLHLLLLSLFNVSPSFFSTAFLILLSGALILATDLLCHQSLCIHVHCVHVCMFVF